eukprot:CAMPEP_0171092526 /NCGR_PEP_ID=MMETSP0766_2-20121228/35880_1 /TAXON_ID=439317 /ORGANISM="Gambierdiscus australes, Strain CAWD 149" /LENGTH=135 /DNA_ID=CAMNT_0011550777 /DNA_START=123 /DNA_END=530 /DNA_ORIENTATION=-
MELEACLQVIILRARDACNLLPAFVNVVLGNGPDLLPLHELHTVGIPVTHNLDETRSFCEGLAQFGHLGVHELARSTPCRREAQNKHAATTSARYRIVNEGLALALLHCRQADQASADTDGSPRGRERPAAFLKQ